MAVVHYEDITPGFTASAGPYCVTEAEILEFGRRFDPRPFHTDPVAARDSVFGGLVAPGSLLFAIRSWLVNQLDARPAYLAGLGLENLTLSVPVRPGDTVFLRIECLERRESASRPNAGIVRFANTMTNQYGETVMTMVASVMVAKTGVTT